MKHYRIVFLLASLLVLSYGAAGASDISAWATNETLGKINVGDTFSIELHFYSTDPLTIGSVSLPLYFYSPNGSVSNIVRPAVRTDSAFSIPEFRMPYPQDTTYDSSIIEHGVWGEAATWPLFDQYSGFSYDGILPDTVNGTFAGVFGGWPASADTVMYISFTFRVDELVSDPGIFCVDSCSIPNVTPAGKFDWLFGVSDPSHIPVFNGPYCWQIITDTTDVRGVDKGVLPTVFELGQNYPNPFNPNTTFEFAIPQKSQVNISVFNILGQKISTIVDAEYGPGYYNATWDGTTDGGTEVASGIYFYKIEADNFKSTKKMMLLR